MIANNCARVRLNKTDFDILAYLQDGRNIAPNIAAGIDRKRTYVNTRLPQLREYELVQKIEEPDVERSGLYELTDLGHLAVEHRDRYDDVDDFEDFLESKRNTD